MFKKIISAVKKFFGKSEKVEQVNREEDTRYRDIVRASIFDSVLVQLEMKGNTPKEEQKTAGTKLERTTYTPKQWTWEEWKNYNKEQVKLLDKIQQTKMA